MFEMAALTFCTSNVCKVKKQQQPGGVDRVLNLVLQVLLDHDIHWVNLNQVNGSFLDDIFGNQ